MQVSLRNSDLEASFEQSKLEISLLQVEAPQELQQQQWLLQ